MKPQSSSHPQIHRQHPAVKPRRELWLFGGLLALLNLPLLWGGFAETLILLPNAAGDGEWWRLITHPWVHVSWYHLLLDGVAFAVLYPMLAEPRLGRRLLLMFGAGLGSAIVSLWAWSPLASQGLCGLSGIDHGLMAITSLEMLLASGDDRTLRRCGWLSFLLVVAKSGFEAISGQAFLSWMHFGLMGSPVAVCHAGGVMGGLLAFLLLRVVPPRRTRTEHQVRTTTMAGDPVAG